MNKIIMMVKSLDFKVTLTYSAILLCLTAISCGEDTPSQPPRQKTVYVHKDTDGVTHFFYHGPAGKNMPVPQPTIAETAESSMSPESALERTRFTFPAISFVISDASVTFQESSAEYAWTQTMVALCASCAQALNDYYRASSCGDKSIFDYSFRKSSDFLKKNKLIATLIELDNQNNYDGYASILNSIFMASCVKYDGNGKFVLVSTGKEL